MRFQNIIFIQSGSNLGFSKANNLGFKACSGDYIMLLNPDAKLINADISKAMDYLALNPDLVLGPRILNPDGSLQESVLNSPGIGSILVEALFLSYFIKPDPDKLNMALLGACLFMHRNIYEKLNGLDENLFWMEDVDFCYRAKTTGYKIEYFDKWEIVHESGQSVKKNLKVAIANQLISKIKFIRKHRSVLEYVLSIFFIQFHILTRIFIFFLFGPFKSAFIQKFLAYCYSQKMLLKYIFAI